MDEKGSALYITHAEKEKNGKTESIWQTSILS